MSEELLDDLLQEPAPKEIKMRGSKSKDKEKDKDKELTEPEKRKLALATTLAGIDKAYGKGAVFNMAARPSEDVAKIPTGSITLDNALGIGGYPRGRIIEIFGPESSGKTTLAIHAIAQVQKAGGMAAIVDAEHAFDPTYAEGLGVNMEELYIAQPDNGEQALDIAERLIRSGSLDLIIIDSVAALVPKAEIEGDMGESRVGVQARLMSQALRKITGAISKSNTACIFINQLREKIGGNSYGNNETTTGGNALKFYASVRLDIRRRAQIKDSSENVMGNHTTVKVVKNKVAPPFRTAAFDIIYGAGISQAGEIVDICEEDGFVKKSGAWYSYEDCKAQGREGFKEAISARPEIYEVLKAKAIEILKAGPVLGKKKKKSKDEDDED